MRTKHRPKFIVLTGPESTGKSNLASYISRAKDLPLLEEQSRIYLDQNGLEYAREDLDHIANLHMDKERELSKLEQTILLDTDILTLYIWSKFVYGDVSEKIMKAVESMDKSRYYLLCQPDIPWVSDPQRNNPNNRFELFEAYKNLIEELDYLYKVISGNYKQREADSLSITSKLLSNNKKVY